VHINGRARPAIGNDLYGSFGAISPPLTEAG
jgi:hypothetical protein